MRHRSLHPWAVGLLLTLGTAVAAAAEFPLPDPSVQVVGEDLHIKTHYSDTLVDIARQYGLGYEEMARANPGVDPWLPGEGTPIVIPGRRILPDAPREGIVVNIPEHRLYYFPKARRGKPRVVITYPVSIGKMDWKTPLGETRIVSKQKDPIWIPPESVRKEHAANGDPLPHIVRPGPDNPLGAFAMRLAIHPGDYLIHGTNNPLAVGMPVTHGCIRMYPEDIATMFPKVPVGTKVRLINEPLKVAWVDGELLLEVHPPVDDQGQTIAPELGAFEQLLDHALGTTTAAINWDYAIQTLKVANGVPVTVGLQADLDGPAPAAQSAPGSAEPQNSPAAQPAETAPAAQTPSPAAQPAAQTSAPAQPGAQPVVQPGAQAVPAPSQDAAAPAPDAPATGSVPASKAAVPATASTGAVTDATTHPERTLTP